NQGYVGSEIAEMIEMPPALEAAWHTHGYYGSVSHNVKAVYQRYLGWYAGDLRFAAELASHAVFADPSSDPAKTLLADVLTRLGYSAECATWRNNFLTGAKELRGTVVDTAVSAAGMAGALTVTQLFDSLAIRVDGKRAG